MDARWAPGAVVYAQDGAPRPALHKENSLPDQWVDVFKPSPKSGWTHIDITEEVFNAVHFQLPDTLRPPTFDLPTLPQPSNVTAIETLLFGDVARDGSATNKTSHRIEHIIASIFADALARSGSWRTPPQIYSSGKIKGWEKQILKGDYGSWSYNKPPPQLDDAVTYFQMKQVITGCKALAHCMYLYTHILTDAYKASDKTDYLAIAVVLIHLLIATTHTIILVFWRRESSECWDTLPELLALSQQSTPSKAVLNNTATAIYNMSSFANITRVLVSDENEGHVKLSFDADHNGSVLRRPDVSQKYG